uniref:flagellin n=1 Tax=Vibrio metschnikovii TaxID=28172 RepID=UPI002FCA6DE5
TAHASSGMVSQDTSVNAYRDLALQSANGTNSDAERQALNEESVALQDELNRIAETTSFGGRRLLNGSFGEASFQIGSSSGEAIIMGLTSIRADDYRMGGQSFIATEGKNKDWGVDPTANDLKLEFTKKDGQEVTLDILAKTGDDIEELATYINGQTDLLKASVDEDGKLQIFVAEPHIEGDLTISGGLATELGLAGGPGEKTTVQNIDMRTVGGSQNAVGILDAALKYIDSQRADLGAKQNRLNHSINNLANIQENVEASKSRIKDTDFAKETTQLTKSQILQQAGTSILAQAKQLPNSAISLLQ